MHLINFQRKAKQREITKAAYLPRAVVINHSMHP